MKRFEYMGSDGKPKRLDLTNPVTVDLIKAMAETILMPTSGIREAAMELIRYQSPRRLTIWAKLKDWWRSIVPDKLDEAWEEVNRIAPGLDTRSPQQIASRPPSSFHLNLVQEPRRGGLHLHIRP